MSQYWKGIKKVKPGVAFAGPDKQTCHCFTLTAAMTMFCLMAVDTVLQLMSTLFFANRAPSRKLQQNK